MNPVNRRGGNNVTTTPDAPTAQGRDDGASRAMATAISLPCCQGYLPHMTYPFGPSLHAVREEAVLTS